MFSSALALCAILTGEVPPCPSEAVRTVALSMELMDSRESRYLFVTDGEFAADVKLIHRRYGELADAPPICDAGRFPGRDYATDAICFNRRYKSNLEDRKKLFKDDWIDEAIQETDALYAVYDCLRDIQCEYYYLAFRRQALAKLRDLIGPIHYYAGTLPASVPVHRFRRID